MSDSTIPHGGARLPIKALRVDVIEGPDAGSTCRPTADVLSVGSSPGNELVLADPTVSRYHLELTAAADGIRVVDHKSTNGTLVNGVRVERGVVPSGTLLRLGRSAIRASDDDTVTVDLHQEPVLAGLHGETPLMRRLMASITRVAAGEAPVMVTGESGTGKELVARAIHDLGPRAAEPFVIVDAGAIPAALISSELFGHEPGAFTGATHRRQGAFELAGRGTLFLDEIGELPAALQSTLLGVLERRRFRRVGGSEELPFEARLVAATHRDLRAEVNAGSFRLDLFYRLVVLQLQVPPLRERVEDIPVLIRHFLAELGCDEPIENLFSAQALGQLAAHYWPGNVRELRNLVEATLAIGEPPPLIPAGEDPHGDLIGRVLGLSYREARAVILTEFERRYLARILSRAGGNVSRAAREARMNRSYLLSLIQRHRAGDIDR